MSILHTRHRDIVAHLEAALDLVRERRRALTSANTDDLMSYLQDFCYSISNEDLENLEYSCRMLRAWRAGPSSLDQPLDPTSRAATVLDLIELATGDELAMFESGIERKRARIAKTAADRVSGYHAAKDAILAMKREPAH